MRHKFTAVVVFFCASQLCSAQTSTATPEQQATKNGICLFTGTPPTEYSYVAVKDLDYEKGSYGSVNDVLPQLVEAARAAGADAVIHYNGAQHFGFFMWRLVRPVVTGTAIKWSPARDVDCAGAGGHFTTGTLEEAPLPSPGK